MGKHKHDYYQPHDDNSSDKKEKGTRIDIDINVTKIVKYACVTSVFIIGIIFGLKAFVQLVKEHEVRLDCTK